MNPFGGLIALTVVYLVAPAVRGWWGRRSDSIVDARYPRAYDALRGVCDGVDVPPFRIVVPLYDQDAEGAA